MKFKFNYGIKILKNQLLLVSLLLLIFTGCKKEETPNNGTFNLEITNGAKLKATFTTSPIANSINTFSFQSTNRAMLFVYFDVSNDEYLDIWPSDHIGRNVKINKKYTSRGDYMAYQDDFEFLATINGNDLSYDYAEITFTKYSVPGEIVGTFNVKKNNSIVAKGDFSFTSK